MNGPGWPCDAYGAEGLQFGAWCFVAGADYARICPSAVVCLEQMKTQRQKVFNRIHRLAAAGIPDFVYLAEQFPSPDTLLGGGD